MTKSKRSVLILTKNYPSKDDYYNSAFVHSRAKEYLKYFEEVVVVCNYNKPTAKDYEYEGVMVLSANRENNILNRIEECRPDVILIHFALKEIIQNVIEKADYPYIIWVHGYEALAWYRRLYDFNFTRLYYQSIIKPNMAQLWHFRRLINLSNANTKNIDFVFVSNWMKRIAESDCHAKIRRTNIIPNPIDDNLFRFSQKGAKEMMNVLMIRPFRSKKYATDIVTESLEILSKREIFSQMKFSIFGKGARESRLYELFKDVQNVNIEERFLSPSEMATLYKSHGISLSLTRQDAQGVSMCEAMSSGLVPITSQNTAIPEFVEHLQSGILTKNNPKEIADWIEWLVLNPKEFQRISKNASSSIKLKTGRDLVISKEIELINYEH
jgi:glycosyltransferase involved in cell wall biosynthesis